MQPTKWLTSWDKVVINAPISLNTVRRNCNSLPKYFDTVRQNVILAIYFSRLWDKKVIHFKNFSIPWYKIVFHLSKFLTLLDEVLGQLSNSLSLSGYNVTVDTKCSTTRTNLLCTSQVLDTFRQKIDSRCKILALWEKTLIQPKKTPTLRDNFLVLAWKFWALFENVLKQLTKFSTMWNNVLFRVWKFLTPRNKIILHFTTFLTLWEKLVITAAFLRPYGTKLYFISLTFPCYAMKLWFLPKKIWYNDTKLSFSLQFMRNGARKA